MTQVSELISKYLVFHDLDDEYQQLLADNAKIEQYEKGDSIFNKGASADSLYIITLGELELLEIESDRSSNLPAQVVKEGELVGWSWLMPEGRWNYFAKALTQLELVCINATPIREKIQDDHEFGYQMYKRLYHTVVERLFNTRCHMYEFMKK